MIKNLPVSRKLQKPLCRFGFTLLLLVQFSFLHAQKMVAQTGNARHLRYVVKPHETFSSIGKQYHLSGQQVADYNNLEYYDDEVLAKYLDIPVNRQSAVITSRSVAATEKKSIKNIPVLTPATPAQQEIKIAKDPVLMEKKPFQLIAKSSAAATVTLKKEVVKIAVPVKPRVADRLEKIAALVRFQLIITAVLIMLIFACLAYKNRDESKNQQVKNGIRKWLAEEILTENAILNPDVAMGLSAELKKNLSIKSYRQFVINEIINGKKSMKGKVGDRFINLYTQLNLQQDSLQKLKSRKWSDVAKGIQELAVMEQKNAMSFIFDQINNRNEYVRMEAQSALVQLSGFSGLWFLNVLNYPISEWQQLKLIELLSGFPNIDIPNLHQLLNSSNKSLVHFTLKIIGVFQQRHLHKQVVDCLNNESESIRHAALMCLKEIYNDYTASLITRRFSKETSKNKLAIISVIAEIGSRENTGFLLDVLAGTDKSLNLAAATALRRLGIYGNHALETFCLSKGQPYTDIYLHVQSNIAI